MKPVVELCVMRNVAGSKCVIHRKKDKEHYIDCRNWGTDTTIIEVVDFGHVYRKKVVANKHAP